MSIFKREMTELEKVVDRIETLSDNAFLQLHITTKISFDETWNNTNFTPEQVVEALGTTALQKFTAHYHAQVFLKAVDPSYVILEPTKKVNFNQDGSAYLTELEVQ
jgi:hypothetical protein